MHNKKRIAIVLAIAFLVTMVLPMSAFAAEFSDVPSSHWAAQNIARMNARGIIGGYEDGTARPDNPVTEFEAILMTSRMMGLDYDADRDGKPKLPFKYPDWPGAYNSAVVAYKAGLIDVKDFTHNSAASREWIAKMLIKCLDAEDELDSVKNEKVVFKDGNKIKKAYVDYVKLAYNKRLIGGYPDKTFRPQKTVSRAELAAFLCRVENQLGTIPANVVVGKVAGVKGVQIEVAGSDGKNYSLKADVNSKIYSVEGKKMGVSGLKVGNPVYAVCRNGIVTYLEVRNQEIAVPTQTYSGSIQNVSTENSTVTFLDENNQEKTVRVDQKTKITKKDTNIVLALKDLKAGESIRVTISTKTQIATEIVAEQKNAGITYEGKATVKGIDREKHMIRFTVEGNDQEQTAAYTDNLEITFTNQTTGNMSQVKEGDSILISADKGRVQKMYVFRDLLVTVDGTVFSVESNMILLADKHYYMFDPAVKVVIDGKTASLTDITSGMKVTLTISGDKVVKIEASNRVTGIVKAVNSGSGLLEVTTKNGTESYTISKNPAIVFYYEQNSELNVLRPGDKISMELQQGKVAKIYVQEKAEVVISEINKAAQTVTLKDGSNRTVIMPVSDTAITVKGKTASIVNLIPYAKATATFNGNQLLNLDVK